MSLNESTEGAENTTSFETTNTIQRPTHVGIDEMENILSREVITNYSQMWSKLDKQSMQIKLHEYAEKYVVANSIPIRHLSDLKTFFNQCLESGKLQKNKEVTYNKEKREIICISALHFDDTKPFNKYTLKNDIKYVSTLRSLTPKK